MGMEVIECRARAMGGRCRLFVRCIEYGESFVVHKVMYRVCPLKLRLRLASKSSGLVTFASGTFYVYFQQSLRPQTQRGSVV